MSTACVGGGNNQSSRSITHLRRRITPHPLCLRSFLVSQDPILGISELFNADTHPDKMNLGVVSTREDDQSTRTVSPAKP